MKSSVFSIQSAFPPLGLNKYGVACWWSILDLVMHHSPCHLWTLTTAKALPDSYYGNMHSNLMRMLRDDLRSGLLKSFGGVRVVEVHPGGHGLHYHWVIRGRVSVDHIRKRATACGFGRIHVDPRPCSPWVAPYLAKYLVKDRVRGVRSWSCIGDYTGYKGRDIEFSSRSIEVYKRAYRDALGLGLSKGQAFVMAKKAQRAFDLFHDDASYSEGNASVTRNFSQSSGRIHLADISPNAVDFP